MILRKYGRPGSAFRLGKQGGALRSLGFSAGFYHGVPQSVCRAVSGKRGAPASQADRRQATPCPLPCHFWATNWKRRKGTWKPAARRAVGVERPRAVDSPLPETRQVLPAGSCWAGHDDDASNSTAFSRHSPGRGKCGRSRRPQSRAATSCRLAAVTPPRRVGSGCNVLSSSSCHTAGARASAFELTAGALTASDGTGHRNNKLCRSGGSDTPHDSGGWFRNRCCDGHHGVLKE